MWNGSDHSRSPLLFQCILSLSFWQSPSHFILVLLSNASLTVGQRDAICVGQTEAMREAASGVLLVLCLGKVPCMK